MTTIEYKALFEVRVLHDFFLFGVDPLETVEARKVAQSYFALSEKSQVARLQEVLRGGRYDIQRELTFALNAADHQAMRGLRLRKIDSPTGFTVAMEVKAEVQPSGATRYRPAITPPDDLTLTFGIGYADPAFGAISNLRLDQDSTDLYLFTNDGPHEGRSLSAPVRPLMAGQAYRMGDLAVVLGALKQAVADNPGQASFWTPVPGQSFVHQGDRRLAANEPWLVEWRSTAPRLTSPLAGVIRISVKNGTGDFSPIDREGLLTTQKRPGELRPKHPVFELRFLSRATYWRYRKMGGFTPDEILAIEQGAGGLLEVAGDRFVTKSPRALARELPPLLPNAPLLRIPNAQPGALQASNGKIFSEIYLNHVPTA